MVLLNRWLPFEPLGRGEEGDFALIAFGPFVVHARLADLNRPQAGLDLARRQMTIADDQSMTVVIQLLTMLAQVVDHFRFNGSLQHLLGT